MHILLSPDADGRLSSVYRRAIGEATELYIASAHLTAWDSTIALNKRCKQITFLVGTDFGLTRKAALHEVLKWLPSRIPAIFGAATVPNGSFHPKLVAWSTAAGEKFCLLGSSNLSKAAFASNCEANMLAPLPNAEYVRITQWLETIAETAEPITNDWVEHHYTESVLPKKRGRAAHNGATSSGVVSVSFSGVAGLQARVRYRRAQQSAFTSISKPLLVAAQRSAAGRIGNTAFWEAFWHLWSEHKSRFQGSGLQFLCKHANWKEANSSLLRILTASKNASLVQLDHLVMKEIDALAKAGNPTRGAWLSETLCHYLPESYPLLNAPVRAWLKHIHWRARRNSTEGQRYVDLARQLRYAVREHPFGAKNLAEVDALIWYYVDAKNLLRKEKA
jgi:hypothetical protein